MELSYDVTSWYGTFQGTIFARLYAFFCRPSLLCIPESSLGLPFMTF